MTTITHQLKDLDLKIIVSDVRWENNGIGSFDYQGRECFDRGQDFIADFIIEEIHINWGDKTVEVSGDLFDLITEMLCEDDSFKEQLAIKIKEGD
jgi:hypothetical protein